MFVNTDPELKPYHFIHSPDFLLPTSLSASGSAPSYGRFEHTPQERERNRWYQLVCTDKTLMNKLVRAFNATNPDYCKDGNRHSFSLANRTLTPIEELSQAEDV